MSKRTYDDLEGPTFNEPRRRKAEPKKNLERGEDVSPSQSRCTNDEYTVGWICAISTEYVAAQAFLDERHQQPEYVAPNDNNHYTLGKIKKHNVVIAVLPDGQYGISSAASVARDMMHSFPNVRIGLMVGIGGGAPSPKHDIRLGDIVVSLPRDGKGGVFPHDFGKNIQGQGRLQTTGFMNQPPQVLLTAVSGLKAQHEIEGHEFEAAINAVLEKKPKLREKYKRPDPSSDRLYQSRVTHPLKDQADCATACGDDPSNLIIRPERSEEDNPAIHYGLIASANQLMKDAAVRDRLAKENDVLCFEMEAAGLMNHFPCLVIRGICDYADTHKNKEWQGYAAMAAAAYAKDLLRQIPPNKVEAEKRIREQLRDVLDDVKTIKSRFDSEETLRILEWLSKIESQKKQIDVLSRHQEGTGKFLLESQEFMDWRDGKDRILWCIGRPGTGKTILTSVIIDTIKKTLDSSTAGMAFLYCVYAERGSQTIEQLLGSVIQQLLLQQNDIPENIRELYDSHKRSNTRPDLAELSRHLGSIVSLFSRVYIVVDAIDECDESNKTRCSLLAHLQNLDTHVQLLFTSRPLEETPPDAIQFEVVTQEDDVRKYLSARIKKEPGLAKFCDDNGGLEEEILDKIIAKAGGMFLLAKLHLQSIATELRLKTIRKALETLPEKLNDMYHDTMERIQGGQEKNRSDLAMKMLMLLSYALRPLKLGEVQHALLTMEAEPGETSIDPDDVYSKELLISICAGIVVLENGTSTIRFVHHTAETYFESNRERLFKNAQIELTKICVTYLSFDEFESGPCQTNFELGERLRSNPFYDYAARNWGHHAREASTSCKEVMDFLECKTKVEASSEALTVTNRFPPHMHGQRYPRQMTGLHLAAYFGVEEAVRALLQKKVEADAKDTYDQTPLSWAARNGHDAVVKVLLENGADPGSKDTQYGRTPLLWAIKSKHEAATKLLLEKEANPGSRDKDGWTPLLYAASYGYEAAVELLLEKGADIETVCNHGRTALHLATQQGQEEMAKLLLGKGANIAATDNDGQTTLHLATWQGYEKTVRLLLEKGANIAAKDYKGRTTLHWAALRTHEKVTKLLLERGADIAATDNNGRTALHLSTMEAEGIRLDRRAIQSGRHGELEEHEDVVNLLLKKGVNATTTRIYGRMTSRLAARRSVEGVVRVLLEKGADIDTTDNDGQRALHRAAANGQGSIVKLLLENGASVETTDDNGRTALHLAMLRVSMIRYSPVAKERDGVARILLEKGANTATRDQWGLTALHYAAGLGYQAGALLLLKKRADITATDSEGRTALHWAAAMGYIGVVMLLLENEADIAARDNSGRTALHWMALPSKELGYKSSVPPFPMSFFSYSMWEQRNGVAELLLKNGAGTAAVDNKRQTTLHLAAREGLGELAKLLLKEGADIAVIDIDGRTPLHWAAAMGHKDVAELLLKNGADIAATDNSGRTPLHWAAIAHHEEVVKLLLQKGADISTTDKDSRTPLQWTLHQRELELVREREAELRPVLDSVLARHPREGVTKLLLEKESQIT
ncbi:hypothetical protein GP486_006166 [Trichoglossum hirsutum]|uniref:Uncharacterized protein n=1 Tax=Trichoglossum hirsutum TaxID=265104 RepID=A0A9P8L7W1_9PEZI|nr:hypothetical protein GP486_006166 [Trichoglossum hirsutum]